MLKAIIIIIAVLIVLAVAAFFFMMPRGAKLEDVAYLMEPRITTMPAQNVIQVVAKGDPNIVAGDAIGLLFKTYYKIDGVPKHGKDMPAPKARWQAQPGAPMSEWVGFFAMQIPENVTQLPQVESKAGLKAEIATWEYGEVAEILHIGSYQSEQPTIEKLVNFIGENGYTIIGEHEEEYMKGPGMFFKGNPDKYLTIIRYRVAKTDTAAVVDTTQAI